mmetsp:Transcript_36462/g.82411  ORF Transcript_36462/g.82411 Transcript_36462/m.82411 type:complete len:205 (-) Transcript_36462:923-1537(-)
MSLAAPSTAWTSLIRSARSPALRGRSPFGTGQRSPARSQGDPCCGETAMSPNAGSRRRTRMSHTALCRTRRMLNRAELQPSLTKMTLSAGSRTLKSMILSGSCRTATVSSRCAPCSGGTLRLPCVRSQAATRKTRDVPCRRQQRPHPSARMTLLTAMSPDAGNLRRTRKSRSDSGRKQKGPSQAVRKFAVTGTIPHARSQARTG